MKILDELAGMFLGLLVIIVGIALLVVPPVGIGVIVFGIYIMSQSGKKS